MPRMFITQSWVGASEYDEGDTYNGEQIGNRNQKSVGVHITRSGDNWYANTQAYADTPKKPVKKRSAFERICTMETAYERLQEQLEELDEDYYSNQLELEDWLYARKIITEKLDKQWKKICKARGWDADEEDANIAVGIRESAMSQLAQDMQQKKHSPWTEQPVAKEDSFWYDVFYGLDESNTYRKLYFFVKRLFK